MSSSYGLPFTAPNILGSTRPFLDGGESIVAYALMAAIRMAIRPARGRDVHLCNQTGWWDASDAAFRDLVFPGDALLGRFRPRFGAVELLHVDGGQKLWKSGLLED